MSCQFYNIWEVIPELAGYGELLNLSGRWEVQTMAPIAEAKCLCNSVKNIEKRCRNIRLCYTFCTEHVNIYRDILDGKIKYVRLRTQLISYIR